MIIKADASSDQYNGDGGTDTLTALSSASIDLAKLNSIEAINGNGFANVSINGTAGDDTLDLSGYSLSGIARINGGLGNDVIIGSGDNDTVADFTIVIDNNAGIGFSDFLGVNPEILIM